MGSATAAARSLPAGFGLGVHAYREFDLVNTWMARTNVPWTYAYHYLSGGLNTGDGWQTWDKGTPFPIAFANDAGHHGYTPVFVYDQLGSTKSTCGKSCDEDRHVLTNLNDPRVTKLWFEDITRLFRLLSQQGVSGQWGYGGRVVVIVEPYLSGYAQAAVRDPGAASGSASGTRTIPACCDVGGAIATLCPPLIDGRPTGIRGFRPRTNL